MENTAHRAIAIVGAGAILPDAANVSEFWQNVKNGRYSISEVRPERWDPTLYYDPDHSAPDKTYSKIGGWARGYVWDPVKWRLPIPPRVVDAMDESQKWAIACTRQALEDYGYPQRPLNNDRTAVILGNAMAGEKHYFTVMRVLFPEYARELTEAVSFAACRKRSAATLWANCMTGWESSCLKSRKTACPANSPTALPVASRTFSTSTAPTTFVTPLAHPRWQRSVPPQKGW